MQHHQTYTITAQQLAQINNALNQLNTIHQIMQGVSHPHLTDQLEAAITQIRQGLDTAYEQEDAKYSRKYDHYNHVRSQHNLQAIWDIYQVEDMQTPHAYPGCTHLLYNNPYGHIVTQPIQGNTWADLYIAADACIRHNGYHHHMFIEKITPSKDQPQTLLLHTGG